MFRDIEESNLAIDLSYNRVSMWLKVIIEDVIDVTTHVLHVISIYLTSTATAYDLRISNFI